MSYDKSVNSTGAKCWSSSSNIYEQTSPNYNIDAVEFLLEKVGALKSHDSESEPFTIVELGAGTGKFTRAALKVLEKRSVKNVKVISTEPIKEMFEIFKEMVPNIEIIQRPANDIGLPSNSADAVIAAQCFHWFANAESISEIHRLLKPDGIFGIICNQPDKSVSWIGAISKILECKYKEIKILNPLDKELLLVVTNHGGFGPENGDDSYRYSMEYDFARIMHKYEGVSVIGGAEDSEKKALLSKIEHVIKTNPDVKDKETFSYDYVTKINWFQKISG